MLFDSPLYFCFYTQGPNTVTCRPNPGLRILQSFVGVADGCFLTPVAERHSCTRWPSDPAVLLPSSLQKMLTHPSWILTLRESTSLMEQSLSWRGWVMACISVCPLGNCLVIETPVAFCPHLAGWDNWALGALTEGLCLKCCKKEPHDRNHFIRWCSLPVMEWLQGAEWMSQQGIPSVVSSCYWPGGRLF